MTLDRSLTLTIKGHFCSLLISNIFPYPLFPRLPLTYRLHPSNTQSTSLRRIPFVFLVSFIKGEYFQPLCRVTFSIRFTLGCPRSFIDPGELNLYQPHYTLTSLPLQYKYYESFFRVFSRLPRSLLFTFSSVCTVLFFFQTISDRWLTL